MKKHNRTRRVEGKSLTAMLTHVGELAVLNGPLSTIQERAFTKVKFRLNYVIGLAMKMDINYDVEFLYDFQTVLDHVIKENFRMAYEKAGEIYAKLKDLSARSNPGLGVEIELSDKRTACRVSQDLTGRITNISIKTISAYSVTPSKG